MWRAFVDESEYCPDGSRRAYSLAAALVPDDESNDIRYQMRSLHRPGKPKLHWIRLSDPMKELVVKSVAALPALHIVVVRIAERREESERARRKTFTRLLHTLENHEVYQVIAESRQRKQNDRDLAFLRGLQASRQIGKEIRLSHTPGAEEPLLWIPDMVAGAVSAAAHGDEQFVSMLAPVLDVIEFEDLPQICRRPWTPRYRSDSNRAHFHSRS